MGVTYQIANTFAATANPGAFITVGPKGRIKGIQLSVWGDLEADGEFYVGDISMVPFGQTGTNDAQGVLAHFRERFNLLTSGAAVSGINAFFPMDIPVNSGQQIYVNCTLSGTDEVRVACLIHVQ